MSEPADVQRRYPLVDVDPPNDSPAYRSTSLRAPTRPLVSIPETLSERTGPVYGHEAVGPTDHDLTRQHDGEPIGQRIVLSGRVLDGDGRPLRGQLIEIWQANAGGRYRHEVDQTSAVLDPNFSGAGRCLTDDEGRYRFVTIRPGAYTWQNHANAWRPAHVHFSLFGTAFVSRLVTQMYFPDDPLFAYDPIFNSVPDTGDRQRLVSAFDLDTTVPEWALGFSWDIVLRGGAATPMETEGDD